MVKLRDTLREYFSYGSFILPLLKCPKTIAPERISIGENGRYFLHFKSPCKKNDTLIIYIHGGGWNSGSPRDFSFIGQKFASEGYDCIMPDYRKAPKAHFDEIADDIFRGYLAVKEYIADRKLSYPRIIAVGSSAGGHLGALLCFDSERRRKYGITEEFDGFISLAGPLCFELPQSGTLDILAGNMFGTKDKALWKCGEPYSLMKEKCGTKILLIQSRHDGLIGFRQAEMFKKRAEELGITAEIFEVTEKRNTHSAYSAGIFLGDRNASPALDRVFEQINKWCGE